MGGRAAAGGRGRSGTGVHGRKCCRRPRFSARACGVGGLADAGGAVVATVSAGVVGRQTAQWAEVSAALWVAEGSAGVVPVVTDCEYMRAGANALARPASLEAVGRLQDTDGDLWQRMLPVLPRVR